MTAKLADTQLWQHNLASLIRSGLFLRAETGEFNGLIHGRWHLRRRDVFGSHGEILRCEACDGCRQPGEPTRQTLSFSRIQLNRRNLLPCRISSRVLHRCRD